MIRSRLVALVLTLEVLLSAFLAFFLLDNKSLWLDESNSVLYARTWSSLVYSFRHGEANMCLYYWLLHGWMHWGATVWWIRSLSALFAIASVPALYALGRRLFGPEVGLLAALLLLLNGFFVQYSQEARAYSLLLLLTTLTSWVFVRMVESGRLWQVTVYCGLCSLTFLAHVFGILLPVAHAVSLTSLRGTEIRWKPLAASTIGVLFVLAGCYLVTKPTEHITLFWLQRPGVRDFLRLFYNFAGSNAGLAIVYLALASLALIRGLCPPRDIWRYAFLATWLGVPILTALAYSFLVQPVFFPRYLLFCLPPLLVLVARGWVLIKGGPIQASVLGLLIFFSIQSLVACYRQPREDWKGAVAFVVSQSVPEDAVIFSARWGRTPFQYYLQEQHRSHRLRLLDVSTGEPAQGPQETDPALWDESWGAPVRTQTLTAENIPGDVQRVWLVLNRERWGHPEVIRTSLERSFSLAEQQEFSSVRVLLYVKDL